MGETMSQQTEITFQPIPLDTIRIDSVLYFDMYLHKRPATPWADSFERLRVDAAAVNAPKPRGIEAQIQAQPKRPEVVQVPFEIQHITVAYQ